LPTSKGPPSSLVQLRTTVWIGDARDTRPYSDMRRAFLLRCTPMICLYPIVDYDPDQSIDRSDRIGFSLVSLAIGYAALGLAATDPDQLCAT
jgi:hypothetical protein